MKLNALIAVLLLIGGVSSVKGQVLHTGMSKKVVLNMFSDHKMNFEKDDSSEYVGIPGVTQWGYSGEWLLEFDSTSLLKDASWRLAGPFDKKSAVSLMKKLVPSIDKEYGKHKVDRSHGLQFYYWRNVFTEYQLEADMSDSSVAFTLLPRHEIDDLLQMSKEMMNEQK